MLKENKPTQFTQAFVTGASSGIGSALCKILAARGIPLIITGRDAFHLNSLASEIRSLVPVTVLLADLAIENDRARVLDKIRISAPDLLVNNAGFGLYGEALSFSTKEQLDILQVDANVVLELTLEGSRAMIAAGKKGVVLNVSSAADRLIIPNFAVYSASKACVSHFSQALDFECVPKGVRILTACPGMVATAFQKRASRNDQLPAPSMSMSSEYAAEQIWKQIEKRQRIHTFDWKTRIGLMLAAILPTAWIARMLGKSVKSRINH